MFVGHFSLPRKEIIERVNSHYGPDKLKSSLYTNSYKLYGFVYGIIVIIIPIL